MRRWSLLTLALLILLPIEARTQVVSGDLDGWIEDGTTAEPIPYVSITVEGPNLQGTRGAVSRADGYFRVIGLPVGTYRVTARHIAYHEIQVAEVTVGLGSTTGLGKLVLMPHSIEMEELMVSGRAPLLDFASTDLGDHLNAELLDRLPTPRDYREVLAFVPQANTSYLGDATNIAGSTGAENQYFIEGVNVTDPFLASSGTRLPQNFVREIQVRKGGYEAKYGKATGGIIDVITHSGSNEFQAQAFGYVTNNDFASDSRRGLADLEQQSFARYDVGVSVGGPILKDRLWYFAAYNPTFSVEDLRIPGRDFFADDTVSHLFAGKLTWRANADTRFDLSVFGDPSHRDFVGGDVIIAPLGTIENPDPLLSERITGAFTVNAKGQRLLGESAIIDFSVSRFEANNEKRALTERGRTEVTYIDNYSDTLSGGNQNFFDHHTTRWALDLATTVFLGSHELQAGVGYEDIQLDEKWIIQTPDGRDGVVWHDDESLWISTVLLNDYVISHRAPSAYVQDSWRITDRLRINAGLRWDGLYVVDPSGGVAASINDGYQPRAGFTYALDDRASRKVSGSYGRFFEQIPMLASGWYFGDFYQELNFYDQNPLPGFPAAPFGTIVWDTDLFLTDDIDGQYLDEFTLGYAQRIGRTWKAEVRGIYRELGRVIEDTILLPSFNQVLGNPGEGQLDFLPDPVRRYRALEFSLQNSVGGRFHVASSYVLSENYGNYPGAYDTDGDNPHAHASSSFWDPAQISEGKLPNDRTHVFKAYGTYGFDFGLSAGAFFTWQSGTPLSIYGGTAVGPSAWSHLVPRGTAGRTPSIWDANIRLAYDLPVAPGSLRSRLLLDVFHLFGQREVVDVDQVQYRVLDEEGNQAGPNPNYGKPIAYQPPMTVRVGIETRF